MHVNDCVKVRLTLQGKHILDENERFCSPREEDAEGYYYFHLWELMMIFGKHMYLGAKSLFVGNEIFSRKFI